MDRQAQRDVGIGAAVGAAAGGLIGSQSGDALEGAAIGAAVGAGGGYAYNRTRDGDGDSIADRNDPQSAVTDADYDSALTPEERQTLRQRATAANDQAANYIDYLTPQERANLRARLEQRG